MQQQTQADAFAFLRDATLQETAKAVIAEHVKNLLNQGLSTEKTHTAIVVFR